VAKEVAVCGVSLDSVEDNRAFAEKFEFPFPLLCDTSGEMSRAYGATTTAKDQYASRYTYVVGTDGKIELAIDTKDPAGQASDLLDKLS
jgi:peroxiredoxin Q/BCP